MYVEHKTQYNEQHRLHFKKICSNLRDFLIKNYFLLLKVLQTFQKLILFSKLF